MLTGRVEISQTKCVCSQDKLRLAWIENLGLYQLEISIRRQRSCGCRAKMLVCLQDVSSCRKKQQQETGLESGVHAACKS